MNENHPDLEAIRTYAEYRVYGKRDSQIDRHVEECARCAEDLRREVVIERRKRDMMLKIGR